MRKDWSVPDIINEINKISLAESDPRATGFETWGCKKDLYILYWYIGRRLEKCSTYADEEKFIKDHEKQEIWRILNGK